MSIFDEEILPTSQSEQTQKFYKNVIRLDDTSSEMNLTRLMRYLDKYHSKRRHSIEELPFNIWAALDLYLGNFLMRRYPEASWTNQEQFRGDDLYDLQFIGIKVPVPKEVINLVGFEVYPFGKILKYHTMDRSDENLLTWLRGIQMYLNGEIKDYDDQIDEWKSVGKGVMVRGSNAINKKDHFDSFRRKK